MASDSDVVRITHGELVRLSENYDTKEQNENTTTASKDKKSAVGRKSKRPDIQLYRPGRFRGVQLQDESNEDYLTEGDHEDNQSAGDRGSSVEKDIDDLTENQMGVAGMDKKQRKKRPDIPLYIPKRRQQAMEERTEKEECAEGEIVDPKEDSGGAVVQPNDRVVDLMSMTITFANNDTPDESNRGQERNNKGESVNDYDANQIRQDKGPRPAHSDSNRGHQENQNEGNNYSKLANQERSSGRGRRDTSTRRGGHHQPVFETEHTNLSDQSHDSLEWDYDYHEMQQRDAVNEYDFVESAVFTNSNYAPNSVRGSARKERGRGRGRKERQHAGEGNEPDPIDTGQHDSRGGEPRRRNRKQNQGGGESGNTNRHHKLEGGTQTQHNKQIWHDPEHSEAHNSEGNRNYSKAKEGESTPKPLRQRERQTSGGQREQQKHVSKSNNNNKSGPQKETKQSEKALSPDASDIENLSDILEPVVISSSWVEEVEMEEERERKGSEERTIKKQNQSGKKGTKNERPVKGKGGKPVTEERSEGRERLEGRERPENKKGKRGRKENNRNNGDERLKGLKVTFAQNERQVKVMSDRESSSEEKDVRENQNRSPGDLNWSRGSQPRGGGILHLPARVQPVQNRQPKGNHGDGAGAAQRDHPSNTSRGRGSTRGRGSHRQLYDPNNPKKPLNIQPSSKPLQFHDPYDQFSPADTGSPYMVQPMDYYYEYPIAAHGYYEYKGSPQSEYSMYYLPYQENAYQDDTYARDPYYHSDHEAENVVEGSRTGNKAKAEALFRDVLPLDSQLTNILSRRIHGAEGVQKIMSLRRDIQMKYEQIVLLDPDVANKHNVEQILWKSAFYQVIEVLRKHVSETGEDENSVKEQLVELLEEGNAFYETLLKTLQSTFSFSLEPFVDSSQLPPENLSRTVKLALLSAQRSMICLGDLSRYREQAHHTANYGKARNWYLKAQQIAPKNGRPYNQLAILALYTRRKLDAVYYYMRSLAASNPFITARESLMSLFDEARKKAEVSERRKRDERAKQQQQLAIAQEDKNRMEVWISLDGSRSDGVIGLPTPEDELSSMSAVDLNKQFVLSFMNVHGKLFTKIGMESFVETSTQMLREFHCLLHHSPCPLGNTRLLQLMAVNMFAVENTTPHDDRELDESCRLLIQDQAVALGLDMFGLLVVRCVQLFKLHLSLNKSQVMSEDLHQLFPSVKIWADWMTCHVRLWNPPPMSRDPQNGPMVDAWKALADLCNVLKNVDITHVKLYSQKRDSCDVVILGEDMTMAGFVPLLSVPQIPMYVHNTVDKEIARDCLRIDKMKTFGDYLCGIEPPLLNYNVETHEFVSIAPENLDLSENELEDGLQESDDVIIESDSEEERGEDDFGDDKMKELKSKKEHLLKLQEEKERHQQSVEKVLRSGEVRPIQLEISPLFLVPDTNCFIDHLTGIQALLSSKRFTIVVPLVVINELDGLAKGTFEGKYSCMQHGEMVKDGSRAAVHFLESQFGKRNPNLRALTSKGSIMDTISFRSEEATQEGTNDDLILSCCLHYCKDKARDFMPKDESTLIVLHREVVLLTDDRNLRLKAHTRNVPVRNITTFLRWAKVG